MSHPVYHIAALLLLVAWSALARAEADHAKPAPHRHAFVLEAPFTGVDEAYLTQHFDEDVVKAYQTMVTWFRDADIENVYHQDPGEYSWADVIALYDRHTPCAKVTAHGQRFVDSGEYTHASEIVPGLWIGSACAAADPLWLEDHNIGLVVSVAREHDRTRLPSLLRTVLEHRHYPLDDGVVEEPAEFLALLDEAAASLDTWRRAHPRQAVLVHCNLGISRSTSLVARYLAHALNVSTRRAIGLIQVQRPIAAPHRALRAALGADADATEADDTTHGEQIEL